MKTVQIPPRGESIIFIHFNENDESHPLQKKFKKYTHTQKNQGSTLALVHFLWLPVGVSLEHSITRVIK